MRVILLSTLFLLVYLSLPGQDFSVEKVEPPNWWTGMKWNKVQLMLYGDQLDGLSARFEDERLRVEAVHNLPNISYAFIDIVIPEELPAGDYVLQLKRGTAQLELAYPLRDRRPAEGKYQGFDNSDAIYLITPDRFANGDPSNDQSGDRFRDFDPADPEKRHGGDLQGIIEQLDYIKDLGFTAIWLNPVLENAGPGTYHGYAATDLYHIDPRFGANEDYRRLVEEAHRRSLKVIFDHVANHIGIHHPWIADLPMDDWLNGTVAEHRQDKHYKHAIADPHADPHTEELMRTFWFVNSMPDLNQRNPYLAKYLIQNTLWWIEFSGLDGIREDTYPYPFQEFLSDWEKAVLEEYPQFNIVGEVWANEPAYISLFQKDSPLPRGFETNLPTVMDFPLMQAFRNYLQGEGTLNEVYTVFAQDFLYANSDMLLTFMDNHDTPRGIFIAGEENAAKVRQVLAMLFTTRGIPQVLYGTEINMTGGERHVDLREDFPGGFPGHQRSAFTETGRTAGEQAMFHFLKKLLHLRKEHPALYKGTFLQYPLKGNDDVYKYLKTLYGEQYLVVVNGHGEERKVDLSELQHHLKGRTVARDLLTGTPHRLDQPMVIEAHGAWICKLQ
jgi:glycosidase